MRGGLWPTFFDWLHTDCSYVGEGGNVGGQGSVGLAVGGRVVWNAQLGHKGLAKSRGEGRVPSCDIAVHCSDDVIICLSLAG